MQHFGREHNWLDFRIQPIEKVYLSEELQSSEKEKKTFGKGKVLDGGAKNYIFWTK